MTNYSVELDREHWKVLKGLVRTAMESTQSQQELDRLKVVMNAVEMAGFRASYQEISAQRAAVPGPTAEFSRLCLEAIDKLMLKP